MNWRNGLAARPGSPVGWLSTLLVVVLLGWAGIAVAGAVYQPSGCGRRTALTVASAPVVAAAVATVARTAGPACVDITVVATDSAQFAGTLANPPPGRHPQVWLPESTLWLGRAQAQGAYAVPNRGTSVASSPVVIAMTEPVATQLGWPARPVPWAALLTGVPVGIPDPATDSTAVAALVGVQAITAKAPDPRAAQTAILRRLAGHPMSRAGDPALGAFVTSEQALLDHNAQAGAGRLVAAYPEAAVPSLDFPYVVLPGAARAELAGATAFLGSLLSPAGLAVLDTAGLRGPDGSPGPAFSDLSRPMPSGRESFNDPAARAATPVAMPDQAELVPVLSAWTGVHTPARILGVLDVSGSMAETIPGGGTRLAATVKAMQEGLGLLLDQTEVGFWLFSTQMDGDRDYRVLAAPAPLGNRRPNLAGLLGGVKVQSNGDTGLYDTTLAAYTDARRNWIPGRINLVFIATDGKNDDAHSISRAALLAELARLNDPRRPLPILFIGIGGGIDTGELTEIAAATGGRVFLSPDSGGIRQIFFSALADLGCQPPACRR